MRQMFELFPVPVLWCEGLVNATLLAQLQDALAPTALQPNLQSGELVHSHIISSDNSPVLQSLEHRLLPEITHLGDQLFGQSLDWRVKEMWLNVMQQRGRQSLHNHANSFISGVLYLTESHPSAQTRFVKGLGGRDFVFNNQNPKSSVGPFNADKWIGPAPKPGDVVLFPSYLLHEVPVNEGERRISLAFNAIPSSLNSWGYSLNLS